MFLAIVSFVDFINSDRPDLDKLKNKKVTVFNVEPQVPKKKKPNEKKVVKKKQKQTPNKAPKPKLNQKIAAANLSGSGINFGLFDKASESILGELNDIVMTADSVDQVPIATFQPTLKYPKSARAKGVEGHVTVNMLINAKGLVEKADIIDSLPKGVFDSIVLASINQWRFQPALYKGKRVKVWAEQVVSFDIN